MISLQPIAAKQRPLGPPAALSAPPRLTPGHDLVDNSIVKESRAQFSLATAPLALALVLCLGTMADAGTFAATGDAPQRPVLTRQDRQAIASLLGCLTDAARQYHRNHAGQPAAVQVAARPLADRYERVGTLALPQADLPRPLAPIRPFLTNLPPPALPRQG